MNNTKKEYNIPVLIPENQAHTLGTLQLAQEGIYPDIYGKVRNIYKLPGDQHLLFVATDRVSIFDFVLNARIPRKGEILNAITHFWLHSECFNGLMHHLVEVPEPFLSDTIYNLLSPSTYLLGCNLTKWLDPFELILRKHLGGSVFDEYQKFNTVAGKKFSPGKKKWSKLERIAFTPSTKATSGHDENILARNYYAVMGKNGKKFINRLRDVYGKAYEYAEKRGILILDTKFEGCAAHKIVADEILTPDSSRYVSVDEFDTAMKEGREPDFMDKQVLRNWGAQIKLPDGKIGIKHLDPTNEEHIKFVHSLEVPNDILKQVEANYHKIFTTLTGISLDQYQKEVMEI